MNPNSMCVVENEILRARLKRNKELARDVLRALQSPELYVHAEVLEKLNEIINGR